MDRPELERAMAVERPWQLDPWLHLPKRTAIGCAERSVDSHMPTVPAAAQWHLAPLTPQPRNVGRWHQLSHAARALSPGLFLNERSDLSLTCKCLPGLKLHHVPSQSGRSKRRRE